MSSGAIDETEFIARSIDAVAHRDTFTDISHASRYFIERKETAKLYARETNEARKEIYRQHFIYCSNSIKQILGLL